MKKKKKRSATFRHLATNCSSGKGAFQIFFNYFRKFGVFLHLYKHWATFLMPKINQEVECWGTEVALKSDSIFYCYFQTIEFWDNWCTFLTSRMLRHLGNVKK